MQASIKKIKKWFNKSQKYVLLFSGGYDSFSLLAVAVKNNINITPVWIDNGFNRASEYEIKKQVSILGVNNLCVHKIIPLKKVIQNSKERCYFCKHTLIDTISGVDIEIIDGTNIDDLSEFRPGLKALKERNVKSPLAKLNISKEISKEISISYGIDENIAQKESCIATRINYNYEINNKRLKVIKEIENSIIEHTKDYNVRCRIDDKKHIRIELSSQKSFLTFADKEFRKKIINIGEKIVTFVCLDLKNSRPNEHDKNIKNINNGI